jgi:hypothetical protein
MQACTAAITSAKDGEGVVRREPGAAGPRTGEQEHQLEQARLGQGEVAVGGEGVLEAPAWAAGLHGAKRAGPPCAKPASTSASTNASLPENGGTAPWREAELPRHAPGGDGGDPPPEDPLRRDHDASLGLLLLFTV